MQAKDAYYVITAEDGFDRFEPNPDGTFIERLLCLESALIAQDEFVEMVSTPYTPEENEVT